MLDHMLESEEEDFGLQHRRKNTTLLAAALNPTFCCFAHCDVTRT